MTTRAPSPVLTGQLRPVERCAACGTAFVCGHAAGLPQCWCASEPLLPARRIVPGQHCLCPGCLRQRQRAQG
nr:cysteine-rich CWC family protein [Cupriavidus gilardii]